MSQKFENMLNLSLETPEGVREESDSLNVGFDNETRSWELIVKYHGSLDELIPQGIRVEYLIAGYAILTVPENRVDLVAALEEVEYVEQPKRFYYEQIPPAGEDCVQLVTRREPFLTGRGVLLAVLDSGIDYRRADFRRTDGDTRIRFLWDQTLQREFDEEQINRALRAETDAERMEWMPSFDVSGHGTAVTGIAAGRSVEEGYTGIAPEAELLIVKLGVPDAYGFPRTTEVMRGVTYALRKAAELQMPLVINLSFGNSYGPHDGSALLERFLDNAAEIGRTVICVGSGNEGNAAGHLAGRISENAQGIQMDGVSIEGVDVTPSIAVVELAVANYERSLSIQLWKNYSDEYSIRLRSPGGVEQELPANIRQGKYTLRMEQTEILIYFGEPTPYSVAQEIYLELLPAEGIYINSGVWTFFLEAERVVTGQYYFYLPDSAVRNRGTGFFRPTPEVTLTAPSTAAKVITVGAYNPVFDAYADFSGRGYADRDRTIGVITAGLVKPDLVAPGVDIAAPDLFGGYTAVTGTSFATPIVSGSAALLMEWGIVRGNDPYLYGEKVKAYLRKGARPLRGEREVPNDRVGFGAVCVSDSIPRG
ncbi:MAG: S8 family serine peptidase [Lachnospiraceae bacterium]|nr:S8 family serine peptidase [Lachnospiraceae bacterium]